MVRGTGRVVSVGTGYAVMVGVLKSITAGAVLRFAAEVVAWAVVVMAMVWSSGFLLHGMILRPGALEMIVGLAAGFFGTLASRALILGARIGMVETSTTWSKGACTFAMSICCFLLVQGIPDIARDVTTLLIQSRPSPGIWGTVLYMPALLAIMITSNRWARRLGGTGGAAFMLRWTCWLAVLAAVMILAGVGLGWILSRHPNPELHRFVASGMINVMTPLVASLSALPRLRRVARDAEHLWNFRCRSCGYDMNAIEDAAQCPECGAAWTPPAIGGANSPTIPAKTS